MNKIEDRIDSLEERVSMLEGKCPDCHARIRGWRENYPAFSLDENWKKACFEEGVDFKTGHKIGCAFKDLTF